MCDRPRRRHRCGDRSGRRGAVRTGTATHPGFTDAGSGGELTEPNWSGLDVREASALTGDLELPDTAGTAVKEVPLDTPMHMPDAALNQRFLYSTVDQHGEIAGATSAVYLPDGEAPEQGWPVIAWAHGTVGIGDDCTPSAGHRNDADTSTTGCPRGTPSSPRTTPVPAPRG